MDKNTFEDALARAQKLMLSEDFNAKVEGIAKAHSGKGGAAVDFSSFEKQAFGQTFNNSQSHPTVMLSETVDKANMQKRMDKLPAAIRESFEKTPPMSGQDSAGDSIGSITNKLAKNAMLTENSLVLHSNSAPASNTGIDYSLIKTIIDESVRRNIEEIKGNMLTESKSAGLAGLKMMKGNKIQLVDTNGNLYEGVLTLKRKAQPKA